MICHADLPPPRYAPAATCSISHGGRCFHRPPNGCNLNQLLSDDPDRKLSSTTTRRRRARAEGGSEESTREGGGRGRFPPAARAFALRVLVTTAVGAGAKGAFIVPQALRNYPRDSAATLPRGTIISPGEGDFTDRTFRRPHFMTSKPEPVVPGDGSSSPQRRLVGRMLEPLETEAFGLVVDGESDDEYRVDSLAFVSGGTAPIPNLVTSLIKSIVGSGVLALPAGMAAVGDVPEQVLPISYALFAASAVLNAGFFAVIGTVCGETRSTSFQQCWERSVGPETSWIVATVITLKTFLSCLAFSIILADSASSLLGVPRTVALLIVTVFGVLPLALIRDIKSLAPFSALGLGGVAVTGSSMLVRWLDGSYSIDPVDGPLVSALPDNLRPEFGQSVGGPDFLQSVVLACSLATAFMAHYNAPRFHAELVNNTPERFRIVTGVSYAASAVVFGLIATAGYLTFGGNSNGFVLNNYADSDPLIFASRVALSLSILLTYPLPFVGLRDGCLDLLRTFSAWNRSRALVQPVPTDEYDADARDGNERAVQRHQIEGSSDNLETIVTIGLLFFVTVAATVVRDLSIVISVGGGTFSTVVASVFPTLMLTSLHKKQEVAQDGNRKMAVTIAWIGMLISVSIGMTGVYLALSNASAS